MTPLFLLNLREPSQYRPSRPLRHLDAVLARDQFRDRFAGPQVELQRQLGLWHLLDDQLADSHGLGMTQVAASRAATALAGPQRPQTAFPCLLIQLPTARTLTPYVGSISCQ